MNREHFLLAASAISVGLLIPLADASIKGALLLGLALVVTACLRQRSAAVRHLAWVSALGLLLVLPILSAVLPGWNVLPEAWRLSWQPNIGAETSVAATETRIAPRPMPPAVADIPIDEPTRAGDAQPELIEALHENSTLPWEVVRTNPQPAASVEIATKALVTDRPARGHLVAVGLISLWLCGVLMLGIRLVSSWLSLRHLTRTATEITRGPIFDEFQACCRELSVTRPVRLLQGDANAMPMAWGFVRSHSLVPSVCEHWSSAQRRAVLLHELGHVLRRDPLWHGLVQVATAVYWFHPLVWLAAWRIHIERERACDDLVLNRGVGAHDYAGHLLDIVSQGRFRRIGASVGVAMASTNKLEGRVRSILDDRQDRRPLTRVLLTAGLLIAIAVGTPLAMMRAADRARDDAAADRNSESGSETESEGVATEGGDEAVAPDPAVHLQSARVHFEDSMLVAWNEHGALGLVFETSQSEGDDASPTEVPYRWRFNDGTEEETISEGTLPLGQGEQIMAFSGMTLIVTDASADAATISYDPNSVCVHPLDRTFFTEYDRQIPAQPELRPAGDLAEFLLPDESIQQQMREDDYVGQGTNPGYPRVPLTFKIRYAENGLVVATPDGVAVFDFVAPLDRRDGNEHRQGVEYRWRFVSADGSTDEHGEGEVWELSRDGQSVYSETLHYLEAGKIHIPWSRNYEQAGWIYYDPAFHGVWLIRPEVALELAEPETDAKALQQFAFGPRSIPQSANYSDEIRSEETVDVNAIATGEQTLRGVDLSGHEFAGDWNAMHAAGGPLDREKTIPLGGYIRLQVKTDAPGEWLIYYSPLAENFYARLKVFDDETYFGPIAGDPIALMRLEEYFATSINRHREVDGFGSPQGLTELQYLLTSREPTLVLSGFHVLANLNAMEVYEERYLRMLVDEAADWMLESPDLAVEVEQVIAVMDDHQARIEELKVEIPDDEYTPGREPTEEELAANWGLEVDGLSLAFIPWESGEPTIRLGERVEALLLVRNVSEEPVRLSSIGFMEGVTCSLVDEETEEELSVTFPIFFGGPLTQRYLLQPGEVFGIKKPVFSTGPRTDGDFSAQIDVAPGRTYRLSMSLELPEAFSKDGEGRIVMPASGEFYNRLTAGDVRFRVVEVDGTLPDELEDSNMPDDAGEETNEGSTNRKTLHGFDLTSYLFTGEWPALYEPGAPLDRELSITDGGCWQCVVNPGNWRVHYSPLRGDFYVHHTVNVNNADGEVESVYYGPIEGNPIELLRLENYITESINQTHEAEVFGSPLEINALQSLIDSQEPTLVASGFRVICELDSLEVNETLHLLPSFDAAAEWMSTMPDYEPLVNDTLAAMDRHKFQIEELKIEVPADEYINNGAEPTEEELAANWGPEVDGLSLAIIPWEEGEPSLRLGERVGVWLAVRNMSDEPIRFSSYNMMDGVSTVLVDEETRDELQIWFPAFDRWHVAMRYRLEPGQMIRLKHAAFWTGVQQLQDASAQINVQPGHTYRLSMSLQLPETFTKNGEGRILVPARGEYFNQLEAGVVRIRVAEIDGAVPPELDEADINDAQSNAQPASDNDSGFRRSLHGFDLTPHRFTGDWDALFEIDAPLYRELPVALGGYWGCRVNSHAWTMYYSPLKQLFYVHLRDGDLSEYFGPIEGNAIELLKIEEHLVNSFNRAIGTDLIETSFSLRYIESLMESQEPTLMASGFRTLMQLEELAIYEVHYLRPIVERVAQEAKTGWINDPTVPPELVDRVQPLELIQVPELSDLADAAVAYMNEQHDRIEALKVTIEDSEYTPGRAPTAEELAAEWGPEVDGVALAVTSWYEHPINSSARQTWAAGEVPMLAVGDAIGNELVIRNVTDEPRRISTLNTMDGVSAIMTDEETGYSALLDYVHFTGLATTERYLLQPGEVVTFKQSQISVVEGDLHPLDRPFDPDNREFLYGEIRVREGRSYSIDFSVDVPSAFSFVEEGRIALPAKGEFYNKLIAPALRFEVAAADTTASTDDANPSGPDVIHEDDNGTMRLTPTNAEERELVNQILVWGSNDHEGWRVGALLVNDLDSDEPLTAGDTAGVRYFLQNVTDQPKTILVAPMGDALPVMGAGGRINLNTNSGAGTIELTAQPGEAVSPDGFYVLVDTTGLPDGEYELDSTAAYWMQKADGSGASSPWRVGSVPMTIGAGGKFDGEPMTDDEGIVWGGTVAGLRVGMRLPEGEKQWAVGSLLQGDLFVKNTTTQSITFTWDKPAPLDQNQVVYTPTGEYVQLNSVFYTGLRVQNPQTFTVEPGEQIALGDAKLQSVAVASEPGATDPSQLVAASGEFTWQVHVQLNVPTIPQFLFVVGSGPVPLEIVAAEADGETNDGNQNPEDDGASQSGLFESGIPSPPADPNQERIRLERERLARLIEQTDLVARAHEFEDSISWGAPHDGGRAGMVIVGENEVNAGDHVIVQFYVQNATAEEQSLRLRKFSPSTLQFLAGHNIIRLTASGDSNEITDLVADAGKIVLLEGYLAELDTSGLPDGDYLIEANEGSHAYWIAGPDGQASFDFHMGQCRVRIGEGGDPADDLNTQLIPADDQIWWGPNVAGLRLGMQMLDKQTDWPVGSRIESVIHVVNQTDHDLTFDTWWDLPSNLDMSVYAADEYVTTRPSEEMTPIELEASEFIVFDNFMRNFTVPSGETLELGHFFLESRAEAENENSGPGVPPRLIAESGDFKWIGRLGFRRDDLDGFYCNMETGPAYFSVQD